MTEDLSMICPICSASLAVDGENYVCGQDPAHYRIRSADHIEAWHEFDKSAAGPEAETKLYEALNAGNIAENKTTINTELPKAE
jgi:hypothetical protein